MNGQFNAFIQTVLKIAKPTPHLIKYVLFKTIEGKKLSFESKLSFSGNLVNLNVGDFVQYWMYMDGVYERPWVKLIRERIQGQPFLDIGANVGNFCLSICDVASQVFAIEASSHCCNSIEQAIRKNKIKNIEVANLAVFNRSGESIDLFLSPDTHGNNSIFSAGKRETTERVATITIDDFCKNRNITSLGLIKMDIEGAEAMALKGAQNTLQSLKPDLVIEFNQPTSKLHGQDVAELWSTLSGLGYRAYHLKSGRLGPFALPDDYATLNKNILFVHGSKPSPVN